MAAMNKMQKICFIDFSNQQISKEIASMNYENYILYYKHVKLSFIDFKNIFFNRNKYINEI